MKAAWFTSVIVVAMASQAGCKDKKDKSEGAGTPGAPSAPAPTTPAAPNPYAAAQDICALVPVDKVAAAVGGTEPRTEAQTSAPPSCRYFFRIDTRQASANVQMLDGYDLERQALGDKAKPVPALGDDAWSHAHVDSTVLYVRRGALVFSVNAAGLEDEKRLPMARSVAEVVLANLK